MVSDRALESASEDVLSFNAIALGLSRFLRNENTKPPLTIAITGEWGTGKSSLMNLLRADLRSYKFRPVWYNAWHHQKEEHILASLLENIILQAVPRNLFAGSAVVLTTGDAQLSNLGTRIPDGTIIGARGPHGVFAPDNELNRWFRKGYEKRYGAPPPFTAYHMVQAILGTKAAYEKAKAAASGKDPATDQIIAAFQGLSFETPSGTTKMALGNGHQGIQPMVYGMTRAVDGRLTMINVTRYAADQVNPPEGVKSEDWIKSGFVR